jgi:hypothetical protein
MAKQSGERRLSPSALCLGGWERGNNLEGSPKVCLIVDSRLCHNYKKVVLHPLAFFRLKYFVEDTGNASYTQHILTTFCVLLNLHLSIIV